MTASTAAATRSYDVILFGDEVPGLLALVAAARDYRRQTGRRLRSLVLFKGDSQLGVGGHLVRGGLSYLDRGNIPPDIRAQYGLPTFGRSSAIYQEFLSRAGVNQIALDPRRGDAALRAMLSEIGADIMSRVEIANTTKAGSQLTGIRLTRGDLCQAKQFIDCTINAELAQAAGVPKLKGFQTFGLPESELPVTLTFETEGLSPQRLREVELVYLRRFLNPNDTEAQRLLNIATGGDRVLTQQFRQGLVEANGSPRSLYIGPDYIDVRSRALSITYHAFRGRKWSLSESGMVIDQPNIAILPGGRLSWNSLMFHTTGSQAEALARGAGKPTAAMMQEMGFVEKWLRSLGATAVRPASELYIRHAGNVVGAVEHLSGAAMLAGGVDKHEALGSFGYHLDVRGGIQGLWGKAVEKGLPSITFHHPPLFNIGIRHALLETVPNLAVISPASGYDGYACAAGRIVECNVAVGQGVGIAASLALLGDRPLMEVANWEVREVLEQTGLLTPIYGQDYTLEASRLREFEEAFA